MRSNSRGRSRNRRQHAKKQWVQKEVVREPMQDKQLGKQVHEQQAPLIQQQENVVSRPLAPEGIQPSNGDWQLVQRKRSASTKMYHNYRAVQNGYQRNYGKDIVYLQTTNAANPVSELLMAVTKFIEHLGHNTFEGLRYLENGGPSGIKQVNQTNVEQRNLENEDWNKCEDENINRAGALPHSSNQ